MQNSMHSWWGSSTLAGGNGEYLEKLYNSYLENPNSVPNNWRKYFDGLPKVIDGVPEVQHDKIKEYFKNITKNPRQVKLSPQTNTEFNSKQASVHDYINGHRLLGHLYSKIDPLELKQRWTVPELELSYYGLTNDDLEAEFDACHLAGAGRAKLKDIKSLLEKVYCSTVASEYIHIPDSAERIWLQDRIEHTLKDHLFSVNDKLSILENLTAAEGLEKYLANKYPGAKRFGLEGCDSLIVALYELIHQSGANGVKEVVIGMAHRGRLNVLVNILGKNPSELFDEFEGKHSIEVESGDVKYHQGFSSDVKTKGGNVHLSLAFNPSHLEIVTPVICGSVRAKQKRRKDDSCSQVLPIAIHGDAAFAGQGVVMETLNMALTPGYSIGGTVHIITNNQVGFTTSDPKDARSTLYCSDIGKMMSIPIFHVNAEDPEGLFLVVQIALAYRAKFNKDVIIDIVGYRKYGHNEADEPSATQPEMYKIIRAKKTIRDLYAKKLIAEGNVSEEKSKALISDYRKSLDDRDKIVAKHLISGWKSEFTTDWSVYKDIGWRHPTNTGFDKTKLKELANFRDTIPEEIKLHPRVLNIVNSRKEMTAENRLVDWGYAETLAYATLLTEGFDVRLSGQDCGRGTFFHRHAVWHNQNSGAKEYIALQNIPNTKNKFTVIDSLLSEAAVLGFEYGFSTSEPKALVIWEAQFGDFANGAQVVIDQFISSGEQKWGRLSGLTMLLPHGYEGQGPEHSSARLERYLQLCAQHNIQVCVPSTPGQVFHMLRRQALRPMRKPLIAITPKSLLRHKLAVSSIDDLANGKFYPVIPDDDAHPSSVDRVVLCSGKVYYELLDKRTQDNKNNVAIIRVEQLYPFPKDELKAEINKFPNTKTVVWCQEEPLNQGAWYSSQHNFHSCLNQHQTLEYVGREASASPAAGYAHLHNEQQRKVISDALG